MLRDWIILLPVIENRIDGEKIQVASLEHHLWVIQSPNELWFGDFFVLLCLKAEGTSFFEQEHPTLTLSL